jgi:inner membrane protein
VNDVVGPQGVGKVVGSGLRTPWAVVALPGVLLLSSPGPTSRSSTGPTWRCWAGAACWSPGGPGRARPPVDGGLLLLAAARLDWIREHAREVAVGLACTLLVDVDHIPLYAGMSEIARGGRPFRHSLTTVAVLLVVAAVLPRASRRWLLLAAVGLCVHFVRDVATGPGLPLWWPLSDLDVRAPEEWYETALRVVAVVGTARLSVATWADARRPAACSRLPGVVMPPVRAPDSASRRRRRTVVRTLSAGPPAA